VWLHLYNRSEQSEKHRRALPCRRDTRSMLTPPPPSTIPDSGELNQFLNSECDWNAQQGH